MKKILFVMTQAPHQGCSLQETLDLILTVAAFDQVVSLLFLDNGVWQLLQGQQVADRGRKDTAAIFAALELYEVNQCYVEIESMQERGLSASDLLLPVQQITRTQINELVQNYDVVFND